MRVNAETKSATRQRILESAQKLFAAKGFEAATTRDIASEAGIAVGTLFNYFPSKEAVASCLVGEACAGVIDDFETGASDGADEPLSMEEELFAHIAAVLRKLKPYRKYVAAVLETEFAPAAGGQNNGAPSFRTAHLEVMSRIISRHGQGESLSAVAMQLYWTLFIGVLGFWSRDSSPRQEDTLALLDQSMAMFVGWLAGQTESQQPHYTKG